MGGHLPDPASLRRGSRRGLRPPPPLVLLLRRAPRPTAALPADEEVAERLDSPFESKSDSFYFVDNRLVMHNKAEYRFQGP